MVLKKRKDTGLEIAKWLGPLSMSGKAVYSDSAHPPHQTQGEIRKNLVPRYASPKVCRYTQEGI